MGIRYFFSYTANARDGSGFVHGNATFTLDRPVYSIEDVRHVQGQIAEAFNIKDVVVSSWQRYEQAPCADVSTLK